MGMAPVINQSNPELEKERRFKLKKCGIISVAVVVLVACLVGGMIEIMYYLHMSTKPMCKMVTAYNHSFKDRDGKVANEKIKYDLKNNVTETTVKKDDSEFKIRNDFKRSISVTRTSSKDGAVCYVSTLSKDATEMYPETLEQHKKQPNPDVTDDEPPANETERRFFQAADKPIPDISFLGKKVQAMCKGLKTYWLFPSDEMPPAGMNGSMGDEGDEEAEADGTVGKRPIRALPDRCYPCPFVVKKNGQSWFRYKCQLNRCLLVCYYGKIWWYMDLVCNCFGCKRVWRFRFVRIYTTTGFGC